VSARIGSWIHAQAFTEAVAVVPRALELAGDAPPPALDAAAGTLAEARDDFAAARVYLERALHGYERMADPAVQPVIVDLLTELAGVAMLQGEFARVDELVARVREVAGESIARFADYLDAWLAEERGDDATARELFEAHVDTSRILGNAFETAYALVTLGELEALAGAPDRALDLLAEADAATAPGLSAQLDCYRDRLHGMCAFAHGDTAAAARWFDDALDSATRLGRVCELSWCFDAVAACAATASSSEDAAILFAAAASMRERAGAADPRIEREMYGPARQRATARLGADRAARLAKLARRLPVDDLTERARRVVAELNGPEAVGAA
jgi:tetratricopeptide (TPR) repeat protein